MEQVAYELIAPYTEFACHLADGSEVKVVAGETLKTSDPRVIAVLDQAAHAVKRVKAKES
jgi:hypothetical protein